MSFSFSVVCAYSARARQRALRAAVRRGDAFLLLAPQGARLSDAVLEALQAAAEAAAPDVAALALRVLPDGPDWHCDPVRLESDCITLEGVLLRCAALRAVGGFDPRLSGEAADADVCWRLRGAGYRLLYCPQLEVWKEAPAPPSDALADYCRDTASACVLQAKYGGLHRGLQTLCETVRAPRHFPGVRRALLKALPGCLLHAFAAACRPAPPAARALAAQNGWQRLRRGRCPLTPEARAILKARRPLVSIVVRTCGRPDTLRETLKCLYHQTYRHFEVIVTEDGPAAAQAMLAAEFADLPIRYLAAGQRVGRGRAGNLGLAQARGEFLCFLDDDDFYYPDFLELHLAALCTGRQPGFVISGGMALDAQVESRAPYVYRVLRAAPVLFDHITLMDMCVRCRVAINGAMFRRELYERCGGLREDLDGDEDWAMWLRFWRGDRRNETVPDIARACCLFVCPADPAQAAARLAAYEVFDEQMLADPSLTFLCSAGQIAQWEATVAADVAHLAAHGGLRQLAEQAARHPAADLPPAEKPAADRMLSARQINRYYWFLVRRLTADKPL